MLSYTAAMFFLIITPGPGVLTTAGVGSSFGFRTGLPYMFGIISGALIVMISVATGLAAIVLSVPFVRNILLFASLAYLLYLAFRIASSGSRIAFIETDRPLSYLNGLTLSIINPKGYAVGTTIFSGFAFMADNPAIESTIKIAIFACIAVPVHVIWLYAGSTLKRLGLSSRTLRAINIGMATAMLAVVALALYSSMI